ncbi:bifunctional adenosylcobinamide kinase/adenosylcobinamide-phosphate guanylyltransferase [Gemmiger sp.]
MLTLVIGGAASGKSAYAESLCLRAPLPRTYLATMQVWDAECAARVAKHRAMRAEKRFTTVECPLHLDRLTLPDRGTVLLEDLGNLTANELYDPDGAGADTAAAVLRGIENLMKQCENLILVSNEVFSGGADYAGDTDRYLQALAAVNNAAAARADAVVRVTCGIPVYYKGSEPK